MKAISLIQRYNMRQHEENGLFLDLDENPAGAVRNASGSIYYYLGPDESSVFHQLDCDEYWCYHAGSPLEVWIVDRDRKLTIRKLGVEEGCEPLIKLPKGNVFAAKHADSVTDGTFLSCITVPQFSYEGSRLVPEEAMQIICPETSSFWQDSCPGEEKQKSSYCGYYQKTK